MNEENTTTLLSFRVDRSLKKEADSLFKSLGMNTSVALNIFLTQSVREQGIPFQITKNKSSTIKKESKKNTYPEL